MTNLHVMVKEWNDQIIFLHRIQPGRTDRSYGIHVARLAGLPKSTLKRAQAVLDTLVVNATEGPVITPRPSDEQVDQLSLFNETKEHPAVKAMKSISLETLSPMEAFDHLRKLLELTEETE